MDPMRAAARYASLTPVALGSIRRVEFLSNRPHRLPRLNSVIPVSDSPAITAPPRAAKPRAPRKPRAEKPRAEKPLADKPSAAKPSAARQTAAKPQPSAENGWTSLPRRAGLWLRERWSWRPLLAALRPVRSIAAVAILLGVCALTNLVYQVIHKPTELFFPAGHRFDKEPPETWRQYGPLFRTYATTATTPELLAALVQTESSGNPLTRTYWRWRFSWNPFAIYKPASSAVGLLQMTDPAFAEASRFCIRNNVVVDDDCGFTSLYIRAIPSHAIELASIYLDRQVAGVLARTPKAAPTPQQKQDLATLIHLCGAGPAGAFARHGFQLMPGERCGDHLAAAYLAKVNTVKRQFLKLAANDKN